MEGFATAYVRSLTASIRKAENGFVVSVIHPPEMTRQPMGPLLQQYVEQIERVKEEGADLDGNTVLAALKNMAASMGSAAEEPLRKPVEEYVFSNIDQMFKFMREVFGS
jgi:hypothetical protein